MPKLGTTDRRSTNKDRVELKRATSIRIASTSKATTVLTVNFDQPVVLKGVPQWTTDLPGVTAVSAVSPSMTVVQITFSATIASATEVIIPVIDPAIRNKVGGFVADTTFPLA